MLSSKFTVDTVPLATHQLCATSNVGLGEVSGRLEELGVAREFGVEAPEVVSGVVIHSNQLVGAVGEQDALQMRRVHEDFVWYF